MSKGRKERKRQAKRIYAAEAAALAVLVALAFFAPQMVFGLQDGLRSRDYQFNRQEAQDITLLNTSYERSLYDRLARFAEDTEKGVQMYVTCQDMTPDQEFYDFLYSDDTGLWQDGVMLWAGMEFFSYSMLYDSDVTDWKQYVIYSDDYAKGVNFIIWYVEVENKEGALLRFLLDADSGSLYGISSDYTALREKADPVRQWVDTYGLLEERMRFSFAEDDMRDAWAALGYYYAGLSEKTDYLKELEMYGYENQAIYDEETTAESVVQFSSSDIHWTLSEDSGQLDFTYTYGAYTLDFRITVPDGEWYVNEKYDMFQLTDFEIGFPAIYELIPAFQE